MIPSRDSTGNQTQSSAILSSATLYAELLSHEKIWRDRCDYFLARGYKLRPRYRPGWIPSWTGTTLNPAFCEDSIEQIVCLFTFLCLIFALS
jgi:hypothetical protein